MAVDDEDEMTTLWLLSTLVLTGVLRMTPDTTADVRTVGAVDLSRYVGDWYEVARFPNRFEAKCATDVMASYRRQDGGTVEVINSCRRADGTVTTAKGVARIVDTSSNAKLKVRFAPAFLSFIPLVWGDYWILGLEPQYRWAVVGSPERKYLWVLSRTPDMDEREYAQAVDRALANGFDVSRLEKTKQTGQR
jgi:apolipoprotein D and lipocalin family protein